MKKYLILILLPLFFITACSKRKTLTELRQEEREAINKYIKEQGIQVIKEFPTDTVFAENEYFLSSSGLYIQVVEKGIGGTPLKGDEILLRFYEFNMEGDTTTRAMDKDDTTNAYSFKYDYGEACVGFNEAMSYLQHNSKAKLIIPSSIGFSVTAQKTITPYRYEFNSVKIK